MAVSDAPIQFDIARARGRSIRETPAAERPRERLELRGAAGLTAAELIGLLWGSGARGRSAVDLAADALARFDGLTGLARATGQELEAVPGVGAARAGGVPSPDDLHLTAEALAAGRLLDIDLLDHLVIGHDAYVSLRDRGVSFDRVGPHHPAA